jgi:hypothetical protein
MSIVCVECSARQWLGFAQWLNTKAHKLTSTMSPGTGPELVTANLRLFVPKYTQHEFSQNRIWFGAFVG